MCRDSETNNCFAMIYIVDLNCVRSFSNLNDFPFPYDIKNLAVESRFTPLKMDPCKF